MDLTQEHQLAPLHRASSLSEPLRGQVCVGVGVGGWVHILFTIKIYTHNTLLLNMVVLTCHCSIGSTMASTHTNYSRFCVGSSKFENPFESSNGTTHQHLKSIMLPH